MSGGSEMDLEFVVFVGMCLVIGVFAIKIRRACRGGKTTSFLFLDKGGPFKYSVYDIAENWRGIPLQYPALGWLEPEEEEKVKRRWGWNEFFDCLTVIAPILIIFIGLGIATLLGTV